MAAVRDSAGRSSLDALDQPMRVTTPVGWFLVCGLLGALAIGIVWSALVAVPITVKGTGILHAGGVEDVVSPGRGIVQKLVPKVGSVITAGDLVAVIEQPELTAQISSRETALREAEKRQVELARQQDDMFSAYKAQSAAKVKAAQERVQLSSQRLQWLREREVIFDKMMKDGTLTRDRWLQLKVDLEGLVEGLTVARNEVIMADADIRLRSSDRDRALLQVEHEIAQLRSDLAGLQMQYKVNSEVRTRYAGKVVELKAHESDYVNAGQALFEIILGDEEAVRRHRLVGIVFVSQRDGKKITSGMEAQVAVSSVERSEYGFIQGRVRAVNDYPLSSAGIQAIVRNDQMVRTITQQYGAPFETNVELLIDPRTVSGYNWSSSAGPAHEIKPGDSIDVDFTVENRSLLGLVIPVLARFFVPSAQAGQ
jgi:HlyD family secretion protein